MTVTMLNIKTDAKLKKEAQEVAARLGLPLSAIVNNALRELIRERRVEFVEPLVPNEKTAKILRKAIKDIKEGKNIVSFKNAAELDTFLLSR